MKLHDWLFAHSDVEELHAYLAAQLPPGSDRNIRDILRRLIAQYCQRRSVSEPPASVSIEWIVAATLLRKPWVSDRLTSKYLRMVRTSHGLDQPPAAPTWIQISWREGLQYRRIVRNCNVCARPSVQNHPSSPRTRRPPHEDA